MTRTFQFFKKGTRAYTLTMEQDLLEDWVVRRTWGPQKKPYSHKRVEVFLTKAAAKIRFKALSHYRTHVRGYTIAN